MDVVDITQCMKARGLRMTCSCHFAKEAPERLSPCVPGPSVAHHQVGLIGPGSLLVSETEVAEQR